MRAACRSVKALVYEVPLFRPVALCFTYHIVCAGKAAGREKISRMTNSERNLIPFRLLTWAILQVIQKVRKS